MICTVCDNYLENCVCPDLRERLEGLFKSPYIFISDEKKKLYLDNAQKQDQRREKEKAVVE